MDTAIRPATSDLTTELLTHAPQFGFFQALRLLRLLKRDVQLRPELSLGFPASDIAQIEEQPDQKGFLLTATFLGLYGVSSPLPAFYTEDLFQDLREDSTAPRDFLDMIHQRLYGLLFDGWKKYRLFLKLNEAKDANSLKMLYAISGLLAQAPEDATEGDYPWIRYTGLLGCRPRSVLGLQTLLTDYLGGIGVDILPFMPRRVKIPRDQQFQLGVGQNILGESSFLGEEFTDCQGKFRVCIGPLTHQRFRSLLQEGDEHAGLVGLTDRYLTDPLEYDIQLTLDGAETKPARLGDSEWSRLGLDMVLFSGKFQGDLTVVCPPARDKAA